MRSVSRRRVIRHRSCALTGSRRASPASKNAKARLTIPISRASCDSHHSPSAPQMTGAVHYADAPMRSGLSCRSLAIAVVIGIPCLLAGSSVKGDSGTRHRLPRPECGHV